ncbi:hypothetical protein C8Q74DRAFT_1373532 [Fomes fomentarius]|nr:hypothetical protein C8Q74DRAFT_1373510 [Fomes fomentarius]KAI0755788.1 hypothetical protein C8Q74DRAFT_1373532 [Fomes fomentarius]
MDGGLQVLLILYGILRCLFRSCRSKTPKAEWMPSYPGTGPIGCNPAAMARRAGQPPMYRPNASGPLQGQSQRRSGGSIGGAHGSYPSNNSILSASGTSNGHRHSRSHYAPQYPIGNAVEWVDDTLYNGPRRLCGLNVLESGAIGTLISCQGLVELIVLNVGIQVKILDTRTFSMFVLHALVLTFMTTPLTLLFYPPLRSDIQAAIRTRFAVIVDHIEQLPAVITLTQLLQSSSAVTRESPSVSDPSSDEKAARCTTPPGRGPQISVDALRLIELLNRTSAVLKSQKSDALVHSDPVLAILTTHGYLHPMTVSNSLAVVRYEDFSDNVPEHWRATRWSSFPGRAASRPSTATAGNETPGSSNAYSFDTLFQQKREGNHQAVARHSQYMRRVFADTAADVAMFQDRGFPQAFGPESGARYHVFMPFFGGPDDRVALAFAYRCKLEWNAHR